MQNNLDLNYLSNMILDKERTALYATIATKAIKYEYLMTDTIKQYFLSNVANHLHHIIITQANV